jgi:nicotinate phosphoribosyltransferase
MTDARIPAAQSVLLTDLYQLTMVTAYQELGVDRESVFEFFVRKMPAPRGFLVAAGLQQVVEYLEGLHFADDEIKWLESTGRFSSTALGRLAGLRFTGDVDAMPEGTAFFANEPVLRVTAPLPQAQLVESRIVNLLNFQTMVASKAARCRIAAGPRRLVDFGMRRAHGAEAALHAARAAHLVVELHREGLRIDTVRLDSGDLAALAHDVRATLDTGGCRDIKIVASGNIDEFEIARLLAAGAPIDVFGVGTQLDVSADAPSLDCIYKLQEYDGQSRRKPSAGKATWPGRKQVLREFDEDGRIRSDLVVPAGLHGAGRPLLVPVMRAGCRVGALSDLECSRERASRELASLPDVCARIADPEPLAAQISPQLRELAERVDRDFP